MRYRLDKPIVSRSVQIGSPFKNVFVDNSEFSDMVRIYEQGGSIELSEDELEKVYTTAKRLFNERRTNG